MCVKANSSSEGSSITMSTECLGDYSTWDWVDGYIKNAAMGECIRPRRFKFQMFKDREMQISDRCNGDALKFERVTQGM